jgi:hypothetical protein
MGDISSRKTNYKKITKPVIDEISTLEGNEPKNVRY